MNDGLSNNNFNNYNNNYSDKPNVESKNGTGNKKLIIIFAIIVLMFLIFKFFIERKTQDQLYAELTNRICIAAETYIANNPTILDKTQPGKSTVIKFRTLSDANLLEVQIENPYYEGTFLRKSSQPKYYSMDNSVRLAVLNDGTFSCELVDNANDETSPKLRLNGDSEIVLVVGTEYEDPGYVATDDYDGDVTDKVSMSGNVNSAKAGEYEIAFTVQDSAGNVSTEKRKVIYENYSEIGVTQGSLVDRAIPQISLKGANPYCMVKGTKYEEPGAIAIDNVDGNITDRIAVTNKITGNMMGAFRVVYKVEDSSGNQAIAYRSVIVSPTCGEKEEPKKAVNTRPAITLIGKNSVIINKGTEYIDLGTTAYDKEEGDITNKIVTDTTGVNINSPGIYKVIYRVTDSAGLTVTTARTVTVKEQIYSNPVVRFTETKENIEVSTGDGDDSLLAPPKAVNENNKEISVTKKIEDYATKQTVNSINWNKSGKYRVIYTAIHGNGTLKQTKNMIVTIKTDNVEISGSNSIRISIRKGNKDITEADLIRGGVVFKSKGINTPIIMLSNNEGKAAIAGEHKIKVEAKIEDGPVTSKEITVYVIDNSSKDEPTEPDEKPSVNPDKPTEPDEKPIVPPLPEEPEDIIPVEPNKVKIISNSANPKNVYNTNKLWVGGAITGIKISFKVEPKEGTEIAYFEWSTDCKNIDGTLSKTYIKDNEQVIKESDEGTLTWNKDGSESIYIRAVSKDGISGPWSDPVILLIDRTGPKVEFTHTWADEKEDWHNTPSLKLEYKSSDDESGLSHFEYTFDDVKAKKADEIFTYNEATGDLTVYENTEPSRKELFVYVRAVDKAGNKGEWTFNPAFINIDTVKPNAPILVVSGNQTSVVRINASFKDAESVRPSGFGKLIYTINNGEELIETSKTITMPANTTQTTNKNSVKVWAVDKAGNRSETSTNQIVAVSPASILATGVTLLNGENKIENKESCSLREINPGTAFTLSATPMPSNADQKDVVWHVSNENIAQIDQNGKVVAKRAGTVTITAKIGEVTTSCVLQVKSQVQYEQNKKPNTYKQFTIALYGNGSGMNTKRLSCTTKDTSCRVKLPKINSDYNVIGWSDSKNATKAKYNEGDFIELKEHITLYAITKKQHTAMFLKNGATTIGENAIKCEAYNGNKCEITLPSITTTGEVIGWSSSSTSTTAMYKVNEKIELKGDITLYAITKKTFTATFYDKDLTYVSDKTLSCSAYNTSKNCEIVLPYFNKPGHFNSFWSTEKEVSSDLLGNKWKWGYFNQVGKKYKLTKDTVLYPNFNHFHYDLTNSNYTKFRNISIGTSKYIGNTLFEFETGIPESAINKFTASMNEVYSTMPWLLIPGKVIIMTKSTHSNYYASNIVGLCHNMNSSYGGDAYANIDLKYDNSGGKNEININAAIHELAHAWDSYYKFRTDSVRINQKDDFNDFYNLINEKLHVESSGQKISKTETFAGMVTNYYWHILGKDPSKTYYALKSKATLDTNESLALKNFIEKYIKIANNEYNIVEN